MRGLETGADDYITKPFSEGAGGANQSGNAPYFANGGRRGDRDAGLSLDPTSHRVMAGEEPLEMGPTEFKLLHFYDAS